MGRGSLRRLRRVLQHLPHGRSGPSVSWVTTTTVFHWHIAEGFAEQVSAIVREAGVTLLRNEASSSRDYVPRTRRLVGTLL